MRSPSHNYKHRLGDTVRLACEFRTHYFNLFDNPVIWTKSQKHESKQINIQGNIKYPFVTQKHRFEVSFKPLPPDYVFELVIRGKSPAMCSHVHLHVEYLMYFRYMYTVMTYLQSRYISTNCIITNKLIC